MQRLLDLLQIPGRMLAGIIIAALSGLLVISCHEGHGLSPTGLDAAGSSGISGTLSFVGDWPDSTLKVNVIASKTYPKNITNPDSLYSFVINEVLNGNIVLGDTIPLGVEHDDYTLNLKPGMYEWILVAWFPDIPNYYHGVKELGAYYENSESLPEPVYVRPGEIKENIDMIAHFKNIHREIPFFKK